MAASKMVEKSPDRCRAMTGHVLLAVLMNWMSAADAQVANAGNTPTGAVVLNEVNPCSIVWFLAHVLLMWAATVVTGLFLATTAFTIAAIKFPVSAWDNTYVKLGMAILCLVWLQPLLTNICPHRGTATMPAWFMLQWLFGTTALILGWFNIFKGLDAYVGSWPSGGERKLSNVLWATNLAILAFLYLFLDRLPFIRAQLKDPGVFNPGSTRSAKYEGIASGVETSFQKADLAIVDNEPKQWALVYQHSQISKLHISDCVNGRRVSRCT